MCTKDAELMTIVVRTAKTVRTLVPRHHYNWAVVQQEQVATAHWAMTDEKVGVEAVE